jgi:hydrogenase nickel incorporation protein HypB
MCAADPPGRKTVEPFRIIEIKERVLEHNEREADALRAELAARGTFLLNLMSSPGSGKTTTLLRTLENLGTEAKIGILEADIDSDVDARTIAATGTDAVQIHTGGMCHLDAGMTREGLSGLPGTDYDLVVLENVGNLVCPAEFDTGASASAMILSVPEGDDKPLKYPLMFSVVDALLVNKMDVADRFDFSLEAVVERARALNPEVKIFPVSARTGEGMDAWADWLRTRIADWKAGGASATGFHGK